MVEEKFRLTKEEGDTAEKEVDKIFAIRSELSGTDY